MTSATVVPRSRAISRSASTASGVRLTVVRTMGTGAGSREAGVGASAGSFTAVRRYTSPQKRKSIPGPDGKPLQPGTLHDPQPHVRMADGAGANEVEDRAASGLRPGDGGDRDFAGRS